MWSKAHADLPALVQSMQPKIGELAKTALGFVASIGGGLLQFLASFIIAGIIMAFGQSGSRGSLAIFERLVGTPGAANSPDLSTATIRAVAQGVIGVALIQAIIVGVGPAGRRGSVGGGAGGDRAGPRHRPGAGADRDLARHRLHLVERRIQHGGGDRLHRAVFVAGMADNVLKPLMLGEGLMRRCRSFCSGRWAAWRPLESWGCSSAPTLLTLGYQIFMGWVAANPNAGQAQAESTRRRRADLPARFWRNASRSRYRSLVVF